jgi:hypothetical protein
VQAGGTDAKRPVQGGTAVADPEHLRVLKQGIDAWSDWRRKHESTDADLARADFNNGVIVDLCEAEIANLSEADKANLILGIVADLRAQ